MSRNCYYVLMDILSFVIENSLFVRRQRGRLEWLLYIMGSLQHTTNSRLFIDNLSGCETTVSTCIYYKSVWTGIRARDLGVRVRDSNHYPVGADKKVSQSLPLYIAIRMSRNCYYILMDILSL